MCSWVLILSLNVVYFRGMPSAPPILAFGSTVKFKLDIPLKGICYKKETLYTNPLRICYLF